MKIEEFTGKSFVFAVAHGYDVVWRKLNARLRQRGCNLTEALVVIALFYEEGKNAHPSALAAALRTSRGNISHCLARLERQKYVGRSLAAGDARKLTIALTASGGRLALELIGEIEQIEAHCEEQMAANAGRGVLKALFALGG